MPKLITKFYAEHEKASASVIFVLVIIAAYSPVLFLGQTYNESTPIPPEFLGYHGKSTLFATVGSKWGDFHAIWPNLELATGLFKKGEIPLWNPYVAVGKPLAADAEYHIFSPLTLPYLMPEKFWDVSLLISLWVAGISTFLFLRSIGLNFASSIAGGIFYMLSGQFVSDLPNPNNAVMVFTPLILFSLEKIIQSRNVKYIVLGSTAISCGILGSYPEPIILQLLVVVSYLFYRIIYLSILFGGRKNSSKIQNEIVLSSVYDAKRILSWSALAFLGGVGLSSIFLIPALEFIKNLVLGHDVNYGLWYVSPVNILFTFVPNGLGLLQANWTNIDGPLWDYVGVLALFFSILGIVSVWSTTNKIHKYTPLFFLALSVFFIMKTVGVPVVNWIGYLPILNLVYFTKNVNSIITIGFAVTAAFGIDLLCRSKIKTKHLYLVFLVSVSLILLLLIPLIPYLSSDAKFPPYVTINDARNYVSFQIIQSILFAFMALLTSIALIRNRSAVLGIVSIVLLELSLYIPVGLHPIWMAFKSLIVLSGMGVITFLVLKQTRFSWTLTETKNIKFYSIIIVLLATFAGEVVISDFSPFGMMERYDSFKLDPVTSFLKENIGNSRMFSFDYTLGPDYPAAYKISTVETLGAFGIDSFENFYLNFLDPQAPPDQLGFPPWTYSYGPIDSINKFENNKKYFDFLGVKYILIQGYGFDTVAPGIPGLSGQYAKIESNQNSTGQSFTSPVNSISKIGISLGSSQLTGSDKIILELDSVPYDKRYHREPILNQTIINQQYNEFTITPPLNDIQNKQFYLSLRFPQADISKLAAVFTVEENQTGYVFIKNKLNGKFYQNGIPIDGKEMVFSITPVSEEHLPPVFTFHSINIYENKDAFPRAFLVNKFQIVNSSAKQDFLFKTEDDCLNKHGSCLNKQQDFLLKNPNFDLRNEVILEETLPEQEVDQLKSSQLENDSSAEIILYSPNKVTIKTYSKEASLLVLTDNYYPGWLSFVDGQDTHIYRADGLVRAIFVPSGNHTIEFSYMPKSFLVGLGISLVTITILIGLLIYSKRSRLQVFLPKTNN